MLNNQSQFFIFSGSSLNPEAAIADTTTNTSDLQTTVNAILAVLRVKGLIENDANNNNDNSMGDTGLVGDNSLVGD